MSLKMLGANYMFIGITLLAIFLAIEVISAEAQDSFRLLHDAEVKLKEDLKTNYASNVLPPHNSTSPVTVYLGLSLTLIKDFDIRTSVLTAEGWLKTLWNDTRLQWNETSYSGIKVIRTEHDFMWHPDIRLYNSARASDRETYGDVPAILYSNGSVIIIPPVTLEAVCVVDLRYYPYDEHYCYFKFGSWTHDGFLINVELYNNVTEVDVSDMFSNTAGEWEVINSQAVRSLTFYSCCAEPYPDVNFHIKLRRRSPLFKVAIVCPIVATILLTLLSFWISPVAYERVTLNCLNLVVLIGILLYFAATLPSVGSAIPFIVVCCGVLMVLEVLVTILTVVLSTVAENRKNQPLPQEITSILSSGNMAILCITPPTPKKIEKEVDLEIVKSEDDKRKTTSSCENVNQWIPFFQLVDRISFIIYLLVIFVLFLTAFVY